MDPIFTTTKPLTGHRRSHSDTLFRFEDDSINSTDLFNNLDLDFPSSMNLDDQSEPQPKHKPNHHLRSLSVGSDDFFDGFDFSVSAGENSESERSGGGGGGRPPPPRHRHSSSMDGSVNSSSLMFDAEMENLKKGMAPDRLAELALIDPKRAKRILANRQSAARSKERKIRYTGELERKVQTLQSEATNLSAQVTILQRDTTGLTAENKELKYKLQAMEQQAHLQDALSEALKEEVNRLKIAAGQIPAANGNLFNRDIPPQFSSRPPMFQNFNNSQNQQIHMSQSTNNQTPSSEFSAQSYLHGLQPQG